MEEPKDGVFLLLTSSMPDLVLPTILSRCRKITLYPLPEGDVVKFLRDKYKTLSAEEALLYGRIADGNLQDAISLAGNPDLFLLRREALEEFVKLIAPGGNPFEIYKFFEKHKDDLSFISKQWKLLFLDFMNEPIGGNVVHRDFFEKHLMIPKLGRDSYYHMWELVDRMEQYLKYNGNFQLQVENMLLLIQGEYHDRGSGSTI